MLASLRDRSGTKLVRAAQLVPAGSRSLAALRCSIAIILISNTTTLVAADNPPESKSKRSGSSLFRLPDILKRDRQPAGTHKPASQDRFVARAMQLLTEARALEKRGAAEAALKSAKRSQSVLKTAEHTAGARWPVNEESPAQYISALKRRTGVTGETTPSSAPAREAASGIGTIPPGTTSRRTAAGFASELPGKLPTGIPPLSPTRAPTGKTVLDWGTRTPTNGITLTAGTEAPREQTTRPNASAPSLPTDESGLLFQQLNQLDTWTGIERPAGNASPLHRQAGDSYLPTSAPSKATGQTRSGSPPPLVIPGMIDRPGGIDDQNVEPIPTGLTDSVSGSSTKAVTTTIPVVPDPADRLPTISKGRTTSDKAIANAAESGDPMETVYDQTPRLLTQPDAGTSTRANANSADSDATIWQLAAAQLLSTFLGIILAIAAFLLIRAAASRLFGTRLGVTFQFGFGRSGSGANSSAHASSSDESADVVPFSGQSQRLGQSGSEDPITEPKRAGGVANPEDFPFRVVGTSNGEDEHILEAQAQQEQDSAILQSVFEQNVNLLNSLDKNTGSAA